MELEAILVPKAIVARSMLVFTSDFAFLTEIEQVSTNYQMARQVELVTTNYQLAMQAVLGSTGWMAKQAVLVTTSQMARQAILVSTYWMVEKAQQDSSQEAKLAEGLGQVLEPEWQQEL